MASHPHSITLAPTLQRFVAKSRFAANDTSAVPSRCRESAVRNLKSEIKRSVAPHPARFPEKLPTFFMPSLAHRMGEVGRRPDEGDTVLDISGGSNTTGSAAEKLDRRWMAFEKDRTYLAASAFRFVDELPADELATLWSRLRSGDLPVEVNRQQRDLVLMEKSVPYVAKAKRR